MINDTRVAIVGASGVVGRALVSHFQQSGIPVIGLSRRSPDLTETSGYAFITMDLQDKQQCETVARGKLSNVTHLFYAALFEKPGLIMGWHEADQMQTNLEMLQNLIEPLVQTNNRLRQVSLLQGTKAYGAHVAPMKLPGLERDPRHPHANFYWLQEDYLKQMQAGNNWSYTIWRPQIIFGHALHAPMNMLAAIGVYAALQKANGKPLHYPGGPSGVMEAIDANLLARAIAFSMDNPACSNETFNVTNGDVFTWEAMWPALARIFNMETGNPMPRSLSETLYNESAEAQWRALINQNDLQPITIRDLVGDSFFYADALFNTGGERAPPAAILSTIKLRQAGFQECIDTEDMLTNWFARLQDMKILPPV